MKLFTGNHNLITSSIYFENTRRDKKAEAAYMIAKGQLLSQHIQAYGFISNLPDSPFRTRALAQTQGGILSLGRAHELAPVTSESSSVVLQTNVTVHPPAPPAPPVRDDQFVSQEPPPAYVENEDAFEPIYCGVCQRQIMERDAQMTTPCAHCFHFQCLRPWMVHHATCPLCRANMNMPVPLSSDSDDDVQVQGDPA
jgi:hypothetical protein